MSAEYEVTEWNGIDRRKQADFIFLELMVETRKMMEDHERREESTFQALRDELLHTRSESERRHEELTKRFDSMSQSTLSLINANNATTTEIHKLFKLAFPEGDAEAHRRAHEAWIAKSAKEEEFWLDIKKKAVGAVVTAVVLWVGVVLWGAIVAGPK